MDKVHSAIKSLECVDILQVNVEKDTEVVHSYHGSGLSAGYVKNEETETDASKNAEDPIQDNHSKSDEEDREPPVQHTVGTFLKERDSAASDALATPKTRKKVKTDKDNSTQSNTCYDKRCKQLLLFKQESRHCNVPQRFANNPSLGHWCGHMRTSYSRIQKGMKTESNLIQERIERLEEISFQWKVNGTLFEKRYRELVAFKEQFGH